MLAINANSINDCYIPALSAAGVSHARFIAKEFSYPRCTEIYGEKEPADHAYQVVAGAVRTYKLLSDGRRQIGAFHLFGDVFGLENSEVHRFIAAAIVDTKLRPIRRRSLESAAESDLLVARNLLNLTTNNLQHAEDHMLLLGRKTARERVAAFLLEMDRRLMAAQILALPMCRPGYRRLSGAHIRSGFACTLQSAGARHSRLHRNNPLPDRALGHAETG